MLTPVAAWKTIAEQFSARLRQVSADHFELPTPCPEWNVYELVQHTINAQHAIFAPLTGADIDPRSLTLDDPSFGVDLEPGPDPHRTWDQVAARIVSALDRPGALDEQLVSVWMTRPWREGILYPASDLLLHTWDLARALQLDATLPDGVCELVLDFALPLDGKVHQPLVYVDRVQPPPDANAQTRLLCFSGRQP
ncbi:MAG: TIGR03086 family metal-binding protein [Actinomycetota bacterium]|nr:TIGR03086 family metal-binding protein [Actinomycetota bacterium]